MVEVCGYEVWCKGVKNQHFWSSKYGDRERCILFALAKFLEPLQWKRSSFFIEEQRSKLLGEAWSKGAKLLLEACSKRAKLLEEARAKGSSFLKKLRKGQASLRSLEQRGQASWRS